MRRYLTRANVALGVVVLGVIGFAGQAFALPGDPPTFDASTLTPKLNDFASGLLTAVIVLIGAVLVIKIPFVVIRLAMRTVNRLFGRATPTAT